MNSLHKAEFFQIWSSGKLRKCSADFLSKEKLPQIYTGAFLLQIYLKEIKQVCQPKVY